MNLNDKHLFNYIVDFLGLCYSCHCYDIVHYTNVCCICKHFFCTRYPCARRHLSQRATLVAKNHILRPPHQVGIPCPPTKGWTLKCLEIWNAPKVSFILFEVACCHHERMIQWRYIDDAERFFPPRILCNSTPRAGGLASSSDFHGARGWDHRIVWIARTAWVGSPHPLMYTQTQIQIQVVR